MDIKNELKRTETFKNNVSTIKNQLDDVIVRGGGCTFRDTSTYAEQYKSDA